MGHSLANSKTAPGIFLFKCGTLLLTIGNRDPTKDVTRITKIDPIRSPSRSVGDTPQGSLLISSFVVSLEKRARYRKRRRVTKWETSGGKR